VVAQPVKNKKPTAKIKLNFMKTPEISLALVIELKRPISLGRT
jgi:hypothetical protein